MHYHKISEDEKKSALELLMFMKENRDGTVTVKDADVRTVENNAKVPC
jgi:hypothetical protein